MSRQPQTKPSIKGKMRVDGNGSLCLEIGDGRKVPRVGRMLSILFLDTIKWGLSSFIKGWGFFFEPSGQIREKLQCFFFFQVNL